MSRKADIQSIDGLKQFQGALTRFREVAAQILDEANTEVRQTLHWLQNDGLRYWKKQVFDANEKYVQAKLALSSRLTYERQVQGSPSSCVDERRALKRAEERLQIARGKLARVRYWLQNLDKAGNEFRAHVQGLNTVVTTDIPNARARLEHLIISLEKYLSLAPPQMPVGPEVADEAGSVLRAPTSASDLWVEGLHALRQLTPAQNERDRVPVGHDASNWLGAYRFSPALCRAAAGLCAAEPAVSDRDKVIVVKPRATPTVFYAERIAPSEGDSGWTLGVGQADDAETRIAISLADLTAACPWFRQMSALPAEYLVMHDNLASVEGIVDSENRIVWSSGPRLGREEAS